MSWEIKIPSSTSNLGAGFDSIGLALNLYLELSVTKSDSWRFIASTPALQGVPEGKDNLIYQIAEKTAGKFGYTELPACEVEMKSEIPLARGLGSSATAVIAGIELADLLLDLKLTKEKKVEIAAEIEGHPDNVAPSILGGCVIGHYDGELDWIQLPVEGVRFVAIIPSFELKTSDARGVLPEELSYKTSVLASSIANVSVAAISQQNWKLLGKMMRKDLFHQPYRKKLVPHYDELEQGLTAEVDGLFLSGAGPALIAMTDQQRLDLHLEKWEKQYPDYHWLSLEVEKDGLQTKTLNDNLK